MAGCLGQNREGSVSPETVKRWTENVKNVLATSKGRHCFQTYLADNELEESNLIVFWEMCHQIVPEEVKSPQHTVRKPDKKIWLFSSKKTLTHKGCNLKNEGQEILRFANENVNLDHGYLERLHQAIQDENQDEILYRIWEAKQAAIGLLEATHSHFKQYLLEKKGLLEK